MWQFGQFRLCDLYWTLFSLFLYILIFYNTGPFRNCGGVTNLEFYQDACKVEADCGASVCGVLAAFAQQCQREGFSLYEWRTDASCSKFLLRRVYCQRLNLLDSLGTKCDFIPSTWTLHHDRYKHKSRRSNNQIVHVVFIPNKSISWWKEETVKKKNFNL